MPSRVFSRDSSEAAMLATCWSFKLLKFFCFENLAVYRNALEAQESCTRPREQRRAMMRQAVWSSG